MHSVREVDETVSRQHLLAPSIVSQLSYPLRNLWDEFCLLNSHEGEVLVAPVSALQRMSAGNVEAAFAWRAMD